MFARKMYTYCANCNSWDGSYRKTFLEMQAGRGGGRTGDSEFRGGVGFGLVLIP